MGKPEQVRTAADIQVDRFILTIKESVFKHIHDLSPAQRIDVYRGLESHFASLANVEEEGQ